MLRPPFLELADLSCSNTKLKVIPASTYDSRPGTTFLLNLHFLAAASDTRTNSSSPSNAQAFITSPSRFTKILILITPCVFLSIAPIGYSGAILSFSDDFTK